jgi:hypothetical protein
MKSVGFVTRFRAVGWVLQTLLERLIWRGTWVAEIFKSPSLLDRYNGKHHSMMGG